MTFLAEENPGIAFCSLDAASLNAKEKGRSFMDGFTRREFASASRAISLLDAGCDQ